MAQGFLQRLQNDDRFEIVDTPEADSGFLQRLKSDSRFEIVDDAPPQPAPKKKRDPVTHAVKKPQSALPDSKTGILGDMGSGAAAGVLDATKMPWEALRGLDPPGGIDIVRDYAGKQVDYLEGLEEKYPRVFKPSKETQESEVRKALYGGFRAVGPSVGYGALGAATGGGALGFALGSGGMFAASEFGRYMESALKKGKSYKETLPYAAASAFVEGGGEGLSNFIGAKVFGLTGSNLLPFKQSVKAMLTKNIGEVLKPIGKQLPVEVGTEMGQTAGQAFIAQLQGISDEDPAKAAVDAIGPAIVMTLLFAGGGYALDTRRRKNIREALTSETANPDDRLAAADAVSASLRKKDKTLANM